MSRYIEVNDVANAIYHHFPSIRTMADARSIIDEAPSIDIVRCRECRYFIDNLTEDDTDEAYGECCFDWDIKMPKADDFCSYGVRKTNTTAEEKPTPIRDYMVHGERKESER